MVHTNGDSANQLCRLTLCHVSSIQLWEGVHFVSFITKLSRISRAVIVGHSHVAISRPRRDDYRDIVEAQTATKWAHIAGGLNLSAYALSLYGKPDWT